MRLTVRSKLLAIIALLVCGMLGLSTYLLIELERASDYAAAIYQKDLRNASTIAEIDGLLMRADITVLRMFAIGDPESIAQWKKDNEQRFSGVEKSLDSLRANSGDAQSASIANLRNAFRSLQTGMRHQVERIEAGDIEGGTEVNRVEVKAQSDKVFSILAEMKRGAQAEAQARVTSNLSAAARARYLSIALVIVVSVVAIAFGSYVVRSVTAAFQQALQIAVHIADGRLGNQATVSVQDETGQLLEALGRMDGQLCATVQAIKTTSESVMATSQQIASGNAELAVRTEQQAASLEELGGACAGEQFIQYDVNDGRYIWRISWSSEPVAISASS